MLARHLDFNVPTPTLKNDVKEARQYCSKNLWRLQSLWEDVEVALTTASRGFSARIGEYKKLLKTLIRVVNETYGMWSVKFKMYFVLSGLLNFSKHFQANIEHPLPKLSSVHSRTQAKVIFLSCLVTSNININSILSYLKREISLDDTY